MKCPNCEYNFLTGNVCPECGIDVVIFEKTLKISDVLYNKGLELAKIRDLSGSIDSLTKSIQFNKNNYYARNLLGLAYFEVGKIGDALKQWIISASLVKQNNPAIKYIEEVQQDPNLLDDYNDAIDMYNNALLYIQQKSDDLAVIQLKKALEISPGFIDAMNLLTFCYLIKDEQEMASVLVERTLALDINNPVSLNYYKELYPGRKRPTVVESKEPIRAAMPSLNAGKLAANAKKRRDLLGNNFFLSEILAFIIGGICTLALLYFAYIPGTIADKNLEINDLKDQLASAQALAEADAMAAQDRMDRLERQIGELERENDRLSTLMLTEDQAQRILLAQEAYNNGDYLEAARTIEAIDPIGMDDSTLGQYHELRDNAFRSASVDLFNQGQTYFNQENDDEARRVFELSLQYIPDDVDYEDDIIYYFGRIADRAGNIELAKQYYTTVASDYPQSNRLSYVNGRLSELGD